MQPILLLLIVAIICMIICYIALSFVRNAGKELTELKKSLNSQSAEAALIAMLREANVPYIDNRAKGGAFWIVGGKELKKVAAQARTLGVEFHYKPGGGRTSTRGKDSWWAKF